MERKWLQTKIEFPEKTAKVTLLFGRICSGKSSYREGELIPRIVVSNLVRALISEHGGTANRDKLQNTLYLDNLIADSILLCLDTYKHAYGLDIIVDGIRQVSIVERVLEVYPDAELVWLEVPTEERKRRYESRGDAKDVEPFEIADNKPIELECQNIFSTFKDKITIINNYGIN